MTDSRSELAFVPYERAFDSTFEDMPRRVPDITKLRRLVGYEPRVHLNGIIESVIQYWAAQRDPQAKLAVLRSKGRGAAMRAPLPQPVAAGA
jgi:hypothetical protein